MSKEYFVYILASQKNGTLYIGVTSDINKRVWEHIQKLVKGFTSKYNINTLVYLEIFNSPIEAIKREKYLKRKSRKYKINLIESNNPTWNDLSI